MTKTEIVQLIEDLEAEQATLDKIEGDLCDKDQARYDEIHQEIKSLNISLNW